MSRICVKNLPKYIAEDRLRDFFFQKGEVTDAKIMRTVDGKSRQFAFIGFRTEREAAEAIEFFNNSYLDTCRITCEVARRVGDPNIPRPWSRHSVKKEASSSIDSSQKSSGAETLGLSQSKGAETRRGEAKNSKLVNMNDDSELQEFIQVMQPRSKSKVWANDSAVTPLTRNDRNDREGIQSQKCNIEQSSHVNSELESEAVGNSPAQQNGSSESRDEVVSDMDYLKSRMTKEWSDSESDEDNSPDENGHQVAGEAHDRTYEKSVHEEPDDEKIDNESPSSALETGRLFVRNLPYAANEDDLMELFSKFGDVSEVHIVVNKDTKRSKGIGYVLYALPESALRALEELDNSIFQGRLLHVMPAKQQKPSSDKPESDVADGGVSKSFKQRREDQKKASEAGGDTRAWNSLFMRADTVVENIARKYGVSKSDLLDREADDIAVRIALGETHVIAETKKALAASGVNIDALDEFASGKTNNAKRSNHVILVKNLPYGSFEGDIAKMFGKFGSLDKIILPPTKTLAFVVFLEAAEARAAFKGLAYKRYKDVPLYLEWAPSNILSPSSASETGGRTDVVGEKDVKRVLLEQHVGGISEEDIDPDRVESRSIFIKNLNFKTTDECLRKHFTDNMKDGNIRSVKVKKHLKNGKNVSMGFGFIEFDSVETATNVCRDLQGTILEGHALILQLCHAKKDKEVLKKIDKDGSSTKLIVRNVAFEATEKDLRQLFSPFGQIKSLRLPMKFGGHRGFAFVEYVTKQEAQNAMQALSNTHLYGRHLVLEQAKEGESLEELRARTAAQFADDQGGFQSMSKVSKKRKLESVVDEGNVKFKRIAGF